MDLVLYEIPNINIFLKNAFRLNVAKPKPKESQQPIKVRKISRIANESLG